MTKHLFTLFLYLGLIVTSCVTAWEIVYRFKLYNNTDKDIYIIIDTKPQDEVITIQSECWYCQAKNWRYIDNRHTPWDEIVKDSIHLYILDASMIDLPRDYLSPENAERITQNMLLSRITLYHSQTVVGHHGIFTVNYP